MSDLSINDYRVVNGMTKNKYTYGMFGVKSGGK